MRLHTVILMSCIIYVCITKLDEKKWIVMTKILLHCIKIKQIDCFIFHDLSIMDNEY